MSDLSRACFQTPFLNSCFWNLASKFSLSHDIHRNYKRNHELSFFILWWFHKCIYFKPIWSYPLLPLPVPLCNFFKLVVFLLISWIFIDLILLIMCMCMDVCACACPPTRVGVGGLHAMTYMRMLQHSLCVLVLLFQLIETRSFSLLLPLCKFQTSVLCSFKAVFCLCLQSCLSSAVIADVNFCFSLNC